MDRNIVDRLAKTAAWLKLFAIATSGGWGALILLCIFTPMKEMIDATDGYIGFGLGAVAVLGTILSSLAYWIVTGVNAIEVLLGFAQLAERTRKEP